MKKEIKYKGLRYTKTAAATASIRKVVVSPAGKKAGRVHFWPKEGLVQSLLNRNIRPHSVWKMMLPIALKKAKENPKLAESAHWSQKAGCSCGCSPGFIIGGLYNDINVYLN